MLVQKEKSDKKIGKKFAVAATSLAWVDIKKLEKMYEKRTG